MFWQTLTLNDILRWVGIFIAIAFVTWLGIGLLRRWLLHHQLVAIPNERSSHSTPIPLGAGAIVVAMTLLAWCGLLIKHHAAPWDFAVLAAAGGIAVLSWIDDHAHVPFLQRLTLHFIAAAIAVISLPPDIVIFDPWLPLWLERVLMGIGLVWFMNLYNFMDGIDGMNGSLTATIALGISLVTPAWMDWQLALVLVPIAIGFLIWNWPPAKVFLGDVGSVAIGYLIGWLLLRLALTGNYVPALIVALYPIADTTITLLRRITQGEKFWIPHRRHFFQKAIRSGMTHGQTVKAVWVLQIILIALAVWATERRISPSFLAMIAVGLWLGFCQWRFRYSGAHKDGTE